VLCVKEAATDSNEIDMITDEEDDATATPDSNSLSVDANDH